MLAGRFVARFRDKFIVQIYPKTPDRHMRVNSLRLLALVFSESLRELEYEFIYLRELEYEFNSSKVRGARFNL